MGSTARSRVQNPQLRRSESRLPRRGDIHLSRSKSGPAFDHASRAELGNSAIARSRPRDNVAAMFRIVQDLGTLGSVAGQMRGWRGGNVCLFASGSVTLEKAEPIKASDYLNGFKATVSD
jgi:hypothetical protein